MYRSRVPKHKRPTIIAQVLAEKKPKLQYSGESFYQQHPAWRVSILEMVDPYGWHKIEATKIVEIREKLGNFESMTWSEILNDARKQNHSVPVTDIIPKA